VVKTVCLYLDFRLYPALPHNFFQPGDLPMRKVGEIAGSFFSLLDISFISGLPFDQNAAEIAASCTWLSYLLAEEAPPCGPFPEFLALLFSLPQDLKDEHLELFRRLEPLRL
jgi:hypothetical protein